MKQKLMSVLHRFGLVATVQHEEFKRNGRYSLIM